MQIAAAYDATGTARTGRVSAPDANRVLATAAVRYFDRDDHVPFTTHLQLVSGGRLGARAGYATLRDAMFELGVLTRGERVGAAAIVERDGRYYGHALKGRDLEQGVRAPLKRTYLEEDARASVVELRTSDRFERLRALVDGGWTHRFRA
jgi:hypothetical protein